MVLRNSSSSPAVVGGCEGSICGSTDPTQEACATTVQYIVWLVVRVPPGNMSLAMQDRETHIFALKG